MFKLEWSYKSYENHYVIGNAHSVWNLWWLLKDNKDVVDLRVFSVRNEMEVDASKGLTEVLSSA